MPRNVRNFWITVQIDGRERMIAAGPAGADGGLDCRFYVRHKGAVVPAFDIAGYAFDNGELWLDVVPCSQAQSLGLVDSNDWGLRVNAER
jgi:hypothetical protein